MFLIFICVFLFWPINYAVGTQKGKKHLNESILLRNEHPKQMLKQMDKHDKKIITILLGV